MNYWHIQMNQPHGRDEGNINSIEMLEEPTPIIGTGEWDDLQCRNFKGEGSDSLDNDNIIIVREGQKIFALCQVSSESFTDVSLTQKYSHIFFREVLVLKFYNENDYKLLIAQGTLGRLLEDNKTPSWQLIDKLYKEYLKKQNMQQYITLLESNKNLIFTGAPGTGKTFLARKIARDIILKNENLEDKIEELILEKVVLGMKIKTRTGKEFEIKKNSDNKVSCSPLGSKNTYTLSYLEIIKYITSDKIYDKIDTSVDSGNGSYLVGVGLYVNSHLFSTYTSFVQFHPSYDYTDFIEGLRPVKKDEILGFELKNGIFKAFCKKAKDDPSKKYVFIIDEINRAEISKVFGELMFSIDPGYRGIEGAVATQYANIQEGDTIFDEELGEGKFYIPENVYIIGTMNDIDRSVESFDFALRRRFAWKEITAEDSQKMLESKDWKTDAITKMNALNTAIEKTNGLNSAYHIGAAYFLKLDNYKGDFAQLWNNHLNGILSEYLRGMPDAKTDLAKLKKAYDDGTIDNDGQ